MAKKAEKPTAPVFLQPGSIEELAGALLAASRRRQSVTVGGNFSKNRMAGPIAPAKVTVTTRAMNRILQYEPRDLTISVEAGITYADLSRALAANGQMIPLDPPFSETATIGGILASNGSGPRRRLYGTARDLVIGMKFATLEGKVVQSGGMVVKNVAGLDMGKLLIGSFGTLASIGVVNFKLLPIPAFEHTYLLSFDTAAAALEVRGRILKSVLQPEAIDLMNPAAAARLGWQGWLLALEFGGSAAVLDRCQQEVSQVAPAFDGMDGEDAGRFWDSVRNFTPRFLEDYASGTVTRVSGTLDQTGELLQSFDGPALARAGSGVCYGYFEKPEAASGWMEWAAAKNRRAVIEFAPEAKKAELTLWPAPGSEFEMMKKIKHMFDPENLLNRGRLYRHI